MSLKRIFRRMTASVMAVCMLASGGSFPVRAAESVPDAEPAVNGMVTIEETENGTVKLVNEAAEEGYPVGTQIQIQVIADEGYTMDAFTVTKAESMENVAYNALGGGQMTFTMPEGDVRVGATFQETEVTISDELQEAMQPKEKDTTDTKQAEAQTTEEMQPGETPVDEQRKETGSGEEGLLTFEEWYASLDAETKAQVDQFRGSASTVKTRSASRSAGTANIIPGESIQYFNWSGRMFSATNQQNGGTYTAFCGNASKKYPSGTFPMEEYNQDLVKAAILTNYWDGYEADYEGVWYGVGGTEPEHVYALTHAVISFLYAGDVKGFDIPQSDERWQLLFVTVPQRLQAWVNTHRDVMDRYTMYRVCPGGKYQDILWVEPSSGSIQLQKVSGNTDITNWNPNYSTAGAQYGVYRTQADAYNDTNRIGTLTTDASGNSNLLQVTVGTYYVLEKAASKGYQLDTTLHTVNVTAGQTATFTSAEPPMNDPVGITIQKMDADGNTVGPEGSGSLEGAEFTVKYYAVDPASVNKASDLNGQSATRIWVLQTKYLDGKYRALLADECWVSGDAFYRDALGQPCLPHGVITVQETKAPTGYTLDNAYIAGTGEGLAVENGIVLIKMENLWNIATVTTSNGIVLNEDNPIAVKEQVIRGGVTFQKRDLESEDPTPQGAGTFTGVTIEIINLNDNYVRVEGRDYAKNETVKTVTINREDGSWTSAADLLPHGTYRAIETASGEGYLAQGVTEQTFSITKNGEIVDLSSAEHSFKDQVIRGDFSFTKREALTAKVMADIPFEITSATTGESHTVVTDQNGYFSSASDYTPHSKDTNGGSAASGLWFGLDAEGNNVPVNDQLGAMPYDAYYIEELPCKGNEGKILYHGSFVIDRADYVLDLGTIYNENQADFGITTLAKDEETGTNYGCADVDATIVDTVSYYGLTYGAAYRLKATLMDKTTGGAVVNADGEPVTAEKRFSAAAEHGEIENVLTFDATDYAGHDVVVFEELYDGEGALIAEHKEIYDLGQTIHYPGLGTTVTDRKTGDRVSMAEGKITLTDTVTYTNVQVGKKLTVTGVLIG